MLWDALEYAGDVLDKPGRAVRGAILGRLDELGAAVPFSDSLGLTDPSRRVAGSDIIRALGGTGSDAGDAALGFGAEIALDPLTYLGGAAGRQLLGRGGRAMEKAAAARGPGYATTIDDAAMMASRVAPEAIDKPGWHRGRPLSEFDRQMIAVVGPPPRRTTEAAPNARVIEMLKDAPAAASEIPPGSSLLGEGVEAVVYRTPDGDAVRLSRPLDRTPGRVIDPDVSPATRTADYVGPGGVTRVERTPLASHVGDSGWAHSATPTSPAGRINDLIAGLESRGVNFFDDHPGNIGEIAGRPVVIDPGAVEPMVQWSGPSVPRSPVVYAADPGPVMAALLGAAGGRPAMRLAMSRGYAAPPYEAAGRLAGSAFGATAPAAFRGDF